MIAITMIKILSIAYINLYISITIKIEKQIITQLTIRLLDIVINRNTIDMDGNITTDVLG